LTCMIRLRKERLAHQGEDGDATTHYQHKSRNNQGDNPYWLARRNACCGQVVLLRVHVRKRLIHTLRVLLRRRLGLPLLLLLLLLWWRREWIGHRVHRRRRSHHARLRFLHLLREHGLRRRRPLFVIAREAVRMTNRVRESA